MSATSQKKKLLENALVLADALMERGYGVTVEKTVPSPGVCGLVVNFKTPGYQANMKSILRVMGDGRLRILLDVKPPSKHEPPIRAVLDEIGLGEFVENVSTNAWPDYQDAYLAALTDDSMRAINRQIATWETLKRSVGTRRARTMFWAWMKSLPRDQRSGVDPDGN